VLKEVENYLDELFPNPKCELNFNKDYELLIAVVLSAQTTDKRVNSVTEILFDKYKTLEELSNADVKEIGQIIKPIGTFNKKTVFVKEIAAILKDNYDGKVPNDRTSLEKMPGVGRKTTNVVLSVLFKVPAIAVDTHVARVSKRLGLVKKDDTVNVIEKKLMKKFEKSTWSKRHHQLVLFGRYHCKAISPNCNNCKLKNMCKGSR
jgi:endonuclease-3